MNFMHALHHRTQLLLKSAGWVQSSKRIFAKLKAYNNGEGPSLLKEPTTTFSFETLFKTLCLTGVNLFK